MASQVFIGLGANLDSPQVQLQNALLAIKALPQTLLVKCSSFYSSAPMGPQDQDDYVNAVAEIATDLTPLELLDQLQQIELAQGRVRKAERWGPRTLDLDILLIDDMTINSTRLTVPHYGIKQRNFVLLPLMEIAPTLCLPDGDSIKQLAESIGNEGIIKL